MVPHSGILTEILRDGRGSQENDLHTTYGELKDIDRMHKWRPKMYSFVYVLI